MCISYGQEGWSAGEIARNVRAFVIQTIIFISDNRGSRQKPVYAAQRVCAKASERSDGAGRERPAVAEMSVTLCTRNAKCAGDHGRGCRLLGRIIVFCTSYVVGYEI